MFAYQPSVSNTPSNNTKGIAACANGQWEDFGWVHPEIHELAFDGLDESRFAYQGTVSHDAPNAEVKIKIIDAAAAPYEEALLISPAALASMARREKPPARNMAMP
jgi:hypothetical protein